MIAGPESARKTVRKEGSGASRSGARQPARSRKVADPMAVGARIAQHSGHSLKHSGLRWGIHLPRTAQRRTAPVTTIIALAVA